MCLAPQQLNSGRHACSTSFLSVCCYLATATYAKKNWERPSSGGYIVIVVKRVICYNLYCSFTNINLPLVFEEISFSFDFGIFVFDGDFFT